MPNPSRLPLAVSFCRQLIGVASLLVPAAYRDNWIKEWYAEIWHCWRFLVDSHQWNTSERFHLVRRCFGAYKDAAWCFGNYEPLRLRIDAGIRSSWTCLLLLAALAVVLILSSGGLRATRQLISPLPYRHPQQLQLISLRGSLGGTERAIRSSILPVWSERSHYVQGFSAFSFQTTQLSASSGNKQALLFTVDRNFFSLLGIRLEKGVVPAAPGLVLDHQTWVSIFASDPHILGSAVKCKGRIYRVAAVLPQHFWFLSRQPAAYLVVPELSAQKAMIIARARPGASDEAIVAELTDIAQDAGYLFFNANLQAISLRAILLRPLRFFLAAAVLSALLTLIVFRVRPRNFRLSGGQRRLQGISRRTAFFTVKLTTALGLVFLSGLEISRTGTSFLLLSTDAASGPTMVWLYVLASMAVLFWSVADQRARCRVCLRWLCFPVRMGCPGCLLLDWAGTEFLCSEGHGVLHVPHLAPSWDEQSERWIALDESWDGVFTRA